MNLTVKPEYDIAIIGGGLGGLMCGALLSKEGRRVTVIEKNPRIGGCLQSYSRHGVIFDTGMHVFGGMAAGGNIRRICRYLGIENDFATIDFDPEATAEVCVADSGEKYSIAMGRDKIVESLSRYFPAERQSLKEYVKAIDDVMDDLGLYHLRIAEENELPRSEDFMTAADAFISKYISDAKLRSVLASFNILYAGIKGTTPAYLHSAITSIFLNGACRIGGGYYTFAQALANCIERNGGRIITGSAVSKIIAEGGVVKSLCLSGGKGKIQASAVISSLSLDALFDMIGDNGLFSKIYRSIPELKKDSTSAFIVNVKLRPKSLKFSNGIGFYLDSHDSVWSDGDGLNAEKIMYMTPPSKEQGEWAQTLCAVAPLEWKAVKKWENTKVGDRGVDYLQFKEDMAKKILSKLSAAIPGLGDAIEAIDCASPLTIRDFTGVRHGAMCGYRNDRADLIPFLPVATRVPNLFLTGQNVNMHGFCGVSLTAIQTCEAILGKDYFTTKLSNL